MDVDKTRLSVMGILHWAFGREYASLDLPVKIDEQGFGFGMEYILIQRARLGCSVDTSPGSSSPHEDAETVAAIVSHLSDDLGGRRMAIWIAELGRADRCPDWMPGAIPRLEPLEWNRANQNAPQGKSVSRGIGVYTSVQAHPRNPERTITRRREYDSLWTPCRWSPSRESIAVARNDYQRWWIALNDIRESLQISRILRRHTVTDRMPPRSPWKEQPDAI